jgi:hypothetical protein
VTWFKVDDKWWSHPKAMHLSSGAMGLWVRCGAYCADHLTDGVIALRTIHTITPEGSVTVARWCAELVEAGLWHPTPDGYEFHDWCDHQPTRDQVDARRAAEREKKARQRRNRGGQFTVLPGGMAGDVPGGVP